MKTILAITISALSCWLTAGILAETTTKQSRIQNYEAPGNLESRYELGCIQADELKRKYTPTDLYRAMSKCIAREKYTEGVVLFAVAGVYGRFDAYRVVDKTAHQAVTVARIQAVRNINKEKLVKFQNNLKATLGDPAGLASVCKKIEGIGAPDYYPRYMIQHGMNAFLKGGGGKELDEAFNAKTAWKKSLDTYLHCPDA